MAASIYIWIQEDSLSVGRAAQVNGNSLLTGYSW